MTQPNSKIRVLVAAKERDIRDQIRQMLTADDRVEIAGTASDGQEAVQMTVQTRPHIAILKENLPIFNGLQASEMIALAAPEVKSLLITEKQPTVETLRKAMQVGVRDCVVYPFQDSTLPKAIEALADIDAKRNSVEFSNATDPKKLPKVIAITGGKGGVGKTTIATCLAAYLAKENPGKVALVDMYTQFGDVSLVLNASPSKCIVDLAPVHEEIDQEILESHMFEHPSGLKILVGSTKPEPLDAISPACAESVLHLLKRSYTHIIVDLPPILHATTLYVLGHAYKVIIVTTLFDLPAVRDGKQLYQIIAGDYLPPEKIALVANRASKFDRMKPSDIEKAYGRQVDAVIPNDSQLVTAINRGVPFVTAYSRSPLSTAIAKIAAEIIDQQEPSAETAAPSDGQSRGRSIFARRS